MEGDGSSVEGEGRGKNLRSWRAAIDVMTAFGVVLSSLERATKEGSRRDDGFWSLGGPYGVRGSRKVLSFATCRSARHVLVLTGLSIILQRDQRSPRIPRTIASKEAPSLTTGHTAGQGGVVWI